MQIKEFEADSLKECLQQVRSELGPDAVILETRKTRRGGVLGVGSHDAVAIVAATGITVNSDLETPVLRHREPSAKQTPGFQPDQADEQSIAPAAQREPSGRLPGAARAALRGVYGAKGAGSVVSSPVRRVPEASTSDDAFTQLLGEPRSQMPVADRSNRVIAEPDRPAAPSAAQPPPAAKRPTDAEPQLIVANLQLERSRIEFLEKAMTEIKECLATIQREQRDGHVRTVSAVVSAVAPAIQAVHAAGFAADSDEMQVRFPDLYHKMCHAGMSEPFVQELFDQLPDLSAWSEQAQEPLAISALGDLMSRRVGCSGPILLNPGRAKVVALIGPTGVGKTTTIAKLAANFALMQSKRVALITVDTYRIAAVEQLKTYSQIIGLPVSVAYSSSEVPSIIAQYADYDLVLIDTAGRSQQHAMQVNELKSLVEIIDCETHLVLSAQTKEADMVDAVRRFSAARVDHLIFSKLDETNTFGTLLNVADRTGIPLSYFTTGQKVPEDLESASGARLADLILQ